MAGNISSDPSNDRRVMRRIEVEHMTGIKRAHLYALCASATFPNPFTSESVR